MRLDATMTRRRRGWRRRASLLVAPLIATGPLLSRAPTASADTSSGFNQPGNVLIADQFNNRVIEIDRHLNIVWQYGLGPNDFSPRSIIGTNDAERVGDLTLMAGTGTPPGVVPTCTSTTGCPDNRVILVNPSHKIVWQYGQFGVAGSGPDQLNNPNSAELLPNGHILISDENNNRAIEVTRKHQIVTTFTAGGTTSGVAFSSRLPNGHTLITDSNNSRIVEVDATDHVVWFYFTNTDPLSNPAPLPTRAVRLRNGDTLISDQFNDRVIEVNPAKQIVFHMGTINQPGIGGGLLNAPYDAKVIGDYTGLTNPGQE